MEAEDDCGEVSGQKDAEEVCGRMVVRAAEGERSGNIVVPYLVPIAEDIGAVGM